MGEQRGRWGHSQAYPRDTWLQPLSPGGTVCGPKSGALTVILDSITVLYFFYQVSLLLLNLCCHFVSQQDGDTWQNLYREGLYNEIYTEHLSPSFIGMSFAQASKSVCQSATERHISVLLLQTNMISLCLPACVHVCLPVCLCACLSACVPVCLSVCQAMFPEAEVAVDWD